MKYLMLLYLYLSIYQTTFTIDLKYKWKLLLNDETYLK